MGPSRRRTSERYLGSEGFGLSESVGGAWALAMGVRFKLDSNVNIHSDVDIYPGGMEYNFNASQINLGLTHPYTILG